MADRSLEAQRFGAHVSTAGGLHNAFDAAVAVGCDCAQIFVKNQKQWAAKPLTDEAVRQYQAAQRRTKIKPVIAHAAYLINLGSPVAERWAKSIDALTDELQRCEALGIRGLVVHPGAHMSEGVDAGIGRIVEALDEIHLRTRGARVRILLETTAGQGSAIGWDVEHLGRLVRGARDPDRLGVCLDTCHLFAAGYDLRDPDEYARLFNLLRKEVTIGKIKCIHMNDSKTVLASQVDRHEHIGKGKLGLLGLGHVVNDKRLAKVPKILETPKGTDGRGTDYDKLNLNRLRKLVAHA